LNVKINNLKKKNKVSFGRNIIIKRIKVNFTSWRRVSAVVSRFVKQVFKKQLLYEAVWTNHTVIFACKQV